LHLSILHEAVIVMATGRLDGVCPEYAENVTEQANGRDGVEAHADDALLLERYIARRDESAFAMLVERYGSLVLGVCRRVLQNVHDAEDAFQATFMVLARRARELDHRGPLGNWLYAVAYRTALKARTALVRRRALERQTQDMPARESVDGREWEDLKPVLDEELAKLPEKYRAPLVLCFLQGKSHQEAANALGWPSGSMSRRMSRARELLRERLVRRGILLPSAVLFALVSKQSCAATVSSTLAATTTKASLAFGVGAEWATAAGVAREIVTLAEQIAQTTIGWGLKLKVALAAAVLLLGLIGSTYYVRGSSWGSSLGSGHDGACAAAEPMSFQEGGLLQAHTGPVQALAFSPDGRLLASGSGRPETSIKLWCLAYRVPTAPIATASIPATSVRALAFDGAGQTLAAACADGGIRLWSFKTDPWQPTPAGSLKHGSDLRILAISTDGATLASAGTDATIRLWDMATRKSALLRGQNRFVALAFAPEGSLLAAADAGNRIRIWDHRTGREEAVIESGSSAINALAFTPDGSELAAAGDDGTLHIWDVASRQERPNLACGDGPVQAISFLFGGKSLAWSGSTHAGFIWDCAQGKPSARLEDQEAAITSMASPRDGKLLAIGNANRGIRVYTVTGPQ
jgi:RNA polymerase sigma factor (sigma-70 family)